MEWLDRAGGGMRRGGVACVCIMGNGGGVVDKRSKMVEGGRKKKVAY